MKSTSQNVGLKLLWRDFKSGELNILLISLLLATSTITSISIFTQRIENTIYNEASQFIAADAQIRGSLPIPSQWKQQATTFGASTAETLQFRAMAFSPQHSQLCAIKAVSSEYPLKGLLSIAKNPFGEGKPVTKGPEPGNIWLASRVMASLNIKTGETIDVGEATFRVTAALIQEPDAASSVFGVAPRAMMHINDVPRTGAVQTGSRVTYSWMITLPQKALKQFETALKPQLGSHFEWVGAEQGNQNVDSALDRAKRFLLLAGSLSVLLAGIAIALCAKRYATRQIPSVAVLKTFGVPPKDIHRLYLQSLAVLGLCGWLAGMAIGVLLHWGLIVALGDLIPNNLAPANASAFGISSITSFAALLGFAAPPLLRLKNTAPSQVLRQSITSSPHFKYDTAIGFIAISVIIGLYSGDTLLATIIIGGTLIAAGSVSGLSWAIIQASQILNVKKSQAWKLGLSNLRRHQQTHTLQIMIFAILFMLLMILFTTRTQLLQQWQQQLPEKTPNHFVFNLFEEDKVHIESLFQSNNIQPRPFYPMLRGRITQINQDTLDTYLENTKNNWDLRREINFTWSDTLGEDNKIVQGQWWENTESQSLKISIEEEFANNLGVVLGDTLTFSVAGQTTKGRVDNIRSVQWDSMNPNFYIIFNKPIFEGLGANWLTSFYVPPEQKSWLTILAREIPTLSLIELDQTITQVQSIIQKVSLAIEFILLLVVATGILVLVTCIQATLDIRLQEGALLRALGAKKQLIHRILWIEFSMLGFIAGLLGVLGAEGTLYLLQTQVFQLESQLHPTLWLAGPTLCALLIGSIGWVSTRKVTRVTPLSILQGSSGSLIQS